MAQNPNEDTEWNDILRKHGIIAPKTPPPRTPSPPAPLTLDELLEDFTPEELGELADDTHNEEDLRRIEEMRSQRLEEERTANKHARFGRVYPIGREDYTREVTDASLEEDPADMAALAEDDEDDDEDGKPKRLGGTPVVCILYKPGLPRSDVFLTQVNALAARYPRTKFVSIVGDKCIPDLPDARVPMFIVYRRGNLIHQVMAWGKDRPRRPEEFEALLLVVGALHPPDRLPPPAKRESDDESEEEDGPPRRSAGALTNGKREKNIRKREDDDDDDFDFDM
ncbi:unnamed protein product [Mycena citricolor]|uniref:Phosducin thioredoxin-like domain-containing protein n=1 Tax=Mycena citricolor TaxID=2018698 RepID=A0AAD2HFF8_9AGAR|nr:unnamed protein product [Mycena citricolor]